MSNVIHLDPTERIRFEEVDNSHHDAQADHWIPLLANARGPVKREAFGNVSLLHGTAADGRHFTAVWYDDRMRVRYLDAPSTPATPWQ